VDDDSSDDVDDQDVDETSGHKDGEFELDVDIDLDSPFLCSMLSVLKRELSRRDQ
jgi:hypothetical protein